MKETHPFPNTDMGGFAANFGANSLGDRATVDALIRGIVVGMADLQIAAMAGEPVDAEKAAYDAFQTLSDALLGRSPDYAATLWHTGNDAYPSGLAASIGRVFNTTVSDRVEDMIMVLLMTTLEESSSLQRNLAEGKITGKNAAFNLEVILERATNAILGSDDNHAE
jgi:hypothetical protein